MAGSSIGVFMGRKGSSPRSQMVVLNFSHCHSHGWSRRSQLAVCHGLLGMVYHKLICSVFFQVFKVCKKALKFMDVLGNKPNNCTHASTKKNQTIITRNLYTKIYVVRKRMSTSTTHTKFHYALSTPRQLREVTGLSSSTNQASQT